MNKVFLVYGVFLSYVIYFNVRGFGKLEYIEKYGKDGGECY